MSTRVIFMGTPDFAVPALKALIEHDYNLVGVVTQPDRPKGRGKQLAASPVKAVASEADLPLLQPATLRSEAAVADLTALEPELIVVAAFGQILRPNVLNMPRHHCINIHASLLPRWRGAAPVIKAIQAGDSETGITLMQMDKGLDTGPIIAQRAIPIRPDHTGGSLTAELAVLGAELLIETLPAWLRGQLTPQPQDDSLATLAPTLKKAEGQIDWGQPAADIERQIRAFQPWPSAFTFGPRGQIKILAAEVVAAAEPASQPAEPGRLFERHKAVYVATGRGTLRLITVQPAGKKAMAAPAMLNGQPELRGARLGGM